MTTQKLEVLSQEITDLKALKDKSILINGEGHSVTHHISNAVQALINVIDMSDNMVDHTLMPTIINGVVFTDSITTLQDVQDYLITYKNIALENSQYLNTEVPFVLVSEDYAKSLINFYSLSITFGASYN